MCGSVGEGNRGGEGGERVRVRVGVVGARGVGLLLFGDVEDGESVGEEMEEGKGHGSGV